jgi:GLPGLI family protein
VSLQKALLACFLSAALLALNTGCDGDGLQGSGPIDEGVIVYELSYPQFTEDNIFTSMFPREMTFKFKGNDTKSELKTSMAVFSTSLLAEHDKRTLTHLVRIASKYSGLIMDSAQIVNEYGKAPEGMRIEHTEQTKTIAGFECRHARVTFDSDPERDFDLYYTMDIAIHDPNWCTPFHEIKGVLMEARVNKFNIDMHMVAKSVAPQKFDASEFTVTQKFQPITFEELEDIFQSF